MAAVQQRVLNWLYSVLTSEYQDVNRTYNDTAQALSHYSSLSPKTDVYTYENGTSALLLQLSGTVPVQFRGTTYRYPITIWVPHQYPRAEPIIYVTPTEGMAIRAGQYVDPQGRVYHPYLAGWAHYQDKSNILDFLTILRELFAKEPPVVSRQPQASSTSPLPQSIPPPVPPLPSEIARPSGSPSQAGPPLPPPPPPKPNASRAQQAPTPPPDRYSSAPPLPPTPAARPPVAAASSSYSGPPPPSQSAYNQYTPAQKSSLRYESAPPLPPQYSQQQPSGYRGQPSLPQPPVQTPHLGPQPPYQPNNAPNYQPQIKPQYSGGPPQPQQWQHQPPPIQQWQPQQQPPAQPKPKPQVNLLDDDAPTVTPPLTADLPKPPVPPNPEKDALLHQLAQQLYAIRQSDIQRNTTTLQGLFSQRDALNSALANLQHESSALTSLQSTLTSNTSALTTSISAADKLIATAPAMTPPSIDELLVAPTIVANQLYDLVAEERACGDAIFNLGRAVERGRIETGVFVKATRGLAREWFLKKVLVRKCARGMGLDEGVEGRY